MGVDVRYILGIESGVAQRYLHAAGGAFASRGRRGHVVRVGGVAVAHDLTIDSRPALLRMLQFLEHQYASALAHHKSVPFFVEGP